MEWHKIPGSRFRAPRNDKNPRKLLSVARPADPLL
jgi:hypothetical protein